MCTILQERLSIHGLQTESSESEMEYPSTPPPSDHSGSWPLSPNYQEGNVPTIHVFQHSQEARNLQKLGERRSHRNFKYHG